MLLRSTIKSTQHLETTKTYHLSISQLHWNCVISWSGLYCWIYFSKWSFNRSTRLSFSSGVSELSAVSGDVAVSIPVSRPDAAGLASRGDCASDKLWGVVLDPMPDSKPVAACRVTSLAECTSNWTLDSAASHMSDKSPNWARHRSNRLITLSLQYSTQNKTHYQNQRCTDDQPIIGIGHFADNRYRPISTLVLANCRFCIVWTTCHWNKVYVCHLLKHKSGFRFRIVTLL